MKIFLFTLVLIFTAVYADTWCIAFYGSLDNGRLVSDVESAGIRDLNDIIDAYTDNLNIFSVAALVDRYDLQNVQHIDYVDYAYLGGQYIASYNNYIYAEYAGGEINMGDPYYLTALLNISYSICDGNADRYMLGIFDHAGGPAGYFGSDEHLPNSEDVDSGLTTFDMYSAILDSSFGINNRMIDLMVLEACNLGTLDTALELSGQVHYFAGAPTYVLSNGILSDVLNTINSDPITVGNSLCSDYITTVTQNAANNGNQAGEYTCSVIDCDESLDNLSFFLDYFNLLKSDVEKITRAVRKSKRYHPHVVDVYDFIDWLLVDNLFQPQTSQFITILNQDIIKGFHYTQVLANIPTNEHIISSFGIFLPQREYYSSYYREVYLKGNPTMGPEWVAVLDKFFSTPPSTNPEFASDHPSSSNQKSIFDLSDTYTVTIPFSSGSDNVLVASLLTAAESEFGLQIFGEIYAEIENDEFIADWTGDVYYTTSGNQQSYPSYHYQQFIGNNIIGLTFPFLVVSSQGSIVVDYIITVNLETEIIESEQFFNEGSSISEYTPIIGTQWYPLFKLWDYDNHRPTTLYYSVNSFFIMESNGIQTSYLDFSELSTYGYYDSDTLIHLIAYSEICTGASIASELLLDLQGNVFNGFSSNSIDDPYFYYYYNPNDPNIPCPSPSPISSGSASPSNSPNPSELAQSNSRTPTQDPNPSPSRTRSPSTNAEPSVSRTSSPSANAEPSVSRTPTPSKTPVIFGFSSSTSQGVSSSFLTTFSKTSNDDDDESSNSSTTSKTSSSDDNSSNSSSNSELLLPSFKLLLFSLTLFLIF